VLDGACLDVEGGCILMCLECWPSQSLVMTSSSATRKSPLSMTIGDNQPNETVSLSHAHQSTTTSIQQIWDPDIPPTRDEELHHLISSIVVDRPFRHLSRKIVKTRRSICQQIRFIKPTSLSKRRQVVPGATSPRSTATSTHHVPSISSSFSPSYSPPAIILRGTARGLCDRRTRLPSTSVECSIKRLPITASGR
jgi:hypothetical protein